MRKTKYLWIMLIMLMVLAACSPAGGSEETAVETTSEVMAEESEEVMAEDNAAMSEDAAMMADKEETDMAEEEMTKDDEAMTEHDEEMAEDGEAMTEHDETMREDDEALAEDSEDMMAEDDSMMAELPAWQTIALTDVQTGETFTLADYKGKTVFVEPMATWCTNCRRQLGNVAEARTQLNDDNVVWVSISLETTISDQDLADYMAETGFNWQFAVASPEMIQALAATFGQSVTNPPSTPHFIIRPDGTYTELTTGYESPAELIGNIQAIQG